ncbi:MAG: type II toxin-antitoxin system VapC family toxin [Deltaproteobacteria bacterium]|nr:type II toxin-antitoxin system VapC family toxin [Deltaproteobacteria bacterium]
MGALIDSSVFIAAERGRLDLASWLAAHADQTFALSVVTASELLHGVHRAPAGRRRAARLALVESILATYPVHGVDIDVARVHARVWATMAAKGSAIAAHDLWMHRAAPPSP